MAADQACRFPHCIRTLCHDKRLGQIRHWLSIVGRQSDRRMHQRTYTRLVTPRTGISCVAVGEVVPNVIAPNFLVFMMLSLGVQLGGGVHAYVFAVVVRTYRAITDRIACVARSGGYDTAFFVLVLQSDWCHRLRALYMMHSASCTVHHDVHCALSVVLYVSLRLH